MSRHRIATLSSLAGPTLSCLILAIACLFDQRAAHAEILWSISRSILAHETGPGKDILDGTVKRDDTSSGALYFKFHVDPLSDTSMEEYFAGFQLFEGNTERLGIGNSPK